ncbi:MAG: acetate/propionate family kinase [Actinomycetota bacterium]|nr:acetate/propionate family kinase [Actinomycetota bacterium]
MNGPRPLTEPETVLAMGEIERIGGAGTHLKITVGGAQTNRMVQARDVAEAAAQMLSLLLASDTQSGQAVRVDAVGHRIVHGGPQFVQPVRITDDVLQQLREIVKLAPLHMPGCIAGVEAGRRLLPDAQAVAVFDTAFHHDLPPVSRDYALPRDLSQTHNLRRYGFHGISYAYVAERTCMALGRDAAGTRLILCHLGGGASVCAVQGGKSVDTSMGFTPLEGLVMGTRAGDIDAGLVLYLMQSLHKSAEEVGSLLNKESGLLGLSGGRSSDVRDLEAAAEAGDAAAREALEAFAYRIRKYVGAYAAAMGGVDALIFTDKIGVHALRTRARICDGLNFLGLSLDTERNVDINGSEPAPLGTGDGRRVWAVPTDEERQIARETAALLQNAAGALA